MERRCCISGLNYNLKVVEVHVFIERCVEVFDLSGLSRITFGNLSFSRLLGLWNLLDRNLSFCGMISLF